MIKRKLAVYTVAASALVSAFAHAQLGPTAAETYDHALKRATTVPALESGLFGEHVDLFDGSTVFNVVDIDATTNNGLPLMLSRELSVNAREADRRGDYSGGLFDLFDANWTLDVPYVHGVFAGNQGWLQPSRCPAISSPPQSVYGTGHFYNTEIRSREYWSGNIVNIPGLGKEEIWRPGATNKKPNDGMSYIAVTKSNWYFSCLEELKRGTGQGFVMRAPDGTTYYFDWFVKNGAPPLYAEYCDINGCGESISLFREHVYLYATKVTDRFGNWVEYKYDETQPQRLMSMRSNDGVTIAIEYGPNGKITGATLGTRRWSYSYENGTFKVIQPDLSTWTYSYSAGFGSLTRSEYNNLWQGICSLNVGSKTSAQNPHPSDTGQLTAIAPGGAVGVFSFRRLVHGTNNASGGCYLDTIGTGSSAHLVQRFEGIPKAYQVASIYKKSISGPGNALQTWTYNYQPSWGWKWTECSQGIACGSTASTLVSYPDQTKRRYTFGNDADTNLNQLLELTVENSTGVVVERTSFTYLTTAAGQPFPDGIGSGGGWMTEHFKTRLRPETSRSIKMDGVTFTRAINSFDDLARPSKITRSSTPSN